MPLEALQNAPTIAISAPIPAALPALRVIDVSCVVSSRCASRGAALANEAIWSLMSAGFAISPYTITSAMSAGTSARKA